MASSVDTKDVQTQAPQEADTASAPSNQQDAAMNEANTEILDSVEQRVGPARVKVGGTSEHFDLQGRRGSAPAEVASTHPDQRLRKTSAPEQSFSARGLQQFSAQIPQQHNTSSGTSPYLASNTGASMPDTLVTVPTDVPEQAAMTEANPSTDLISRRQHLADLKKAAHNTLSAFLPAREPSLHDKLETIKAEWGQIAAEIGHCNDVKLQTEKDLDFHFKVLVLPAPEKNDIHGKNLHCSRLRSQCRICLKDLCEQALWDARELSDIYSENGDTPGSHIIVVYLEHAQDSIETCAYTKKYFVEVVSRTCSCPGCRSKTQPLVGKLVGNMSIGWGSDALVSRVGSIFIGRPQQRVSRVSVEQRGFWAYTVMKEWVDRNGVTLAPELIEHPEGGNSEDGKDRNKKRQRGADDDDGEDGDDKEPSPKKRKVETGKSAAGSSKAPGKKTARAPGAIRVAQGETFATSKAAEVTTNGEQGKAPTLKKKAPQDEADEREEAQEYRARRTSMAPPTFAPGSKPPSFAGSKRKAVLMEEGEELTPTGRKKRPPRSMDLGNIFNPELDPSLEDLPRGRTTRGSRNSASSKVAARAEKGAASATKQGIGATASTKHEGSSGNERTSPKTDPTAEKSTLKAADEVVEDAPAARSPRVSERGAGTLETGIESPDAMRVDQGEPPEGDPTVQPTDAGDVGPMAFEPLGTETIDDLYA